MYHLFQWSCDLIHHAAEFGGYSRWVITLVIGIVLVKIIYFIIFHVILPSWQLRV